jgi:hypothetical protein
MSTKNADIIYKRCYYKNQTISDFAHHMTVEERKKYNLSPPSPPPHPPGCRGFPLPPYLPPPLHPPLPLAFMFILLHPFIPTFTLTCVFFHTFMPIYQLLPMRSIG